MNAIISLCHFCELHGPSILFCTQPIHTEDQHEILEASGNHESQHWQYAREAQGQATAEADVGARTSDVEEQGKDDKHCQDAASSTSTPAKGTDTCEACQSFSVNHAGYISNDNEACVSYISRQHPVHQQVFSMVRQACLRSLSCEVCPGNEGPIFFGDDKGHVLSHTFFIKDSHARGFTRWYSIVVIMNDKIFLLNSWPFLVKHLRSIIDVLQAKANSVHESEQAQCPQRRQRLSSSSRTTPANFRQQRGASKPARSLVELTNDKHVFRKLHHAFTWMLKAGGNRLSEKLLEGPPTEDSIIDVEKQEETEEGFVKLFTKKVVVEEHTEEGSADEEQEDVNAPTFFNIRHVLKVLGYAQFHAIAHHIVTGNQVIVRGTQRRLIRSLIDSLKVLLPRGCCRVIYYSDKYEDSWRCNFLGLSPSTVLPPHVDLYVLIDISLSHVSEAEGSLTAPPEDFNEYNFSITSPSPLADKGPGVLSKMEFALLNDSLADTVVEQCLNCLKEEWMNKVKVLFKFTKAGGNRSEDDTRKLLQVVGAHDEDKMVLKFWMTGLSVTYRNHMLSSAIHQVVSS